MRKLVFLTILALFSSGVAIASDRTATLSFAESSPSISNLRFESQGIELKTRTLRDGRSRTVAQIQGSFDEDESHVVVNDRVVAIRGDGKFSVDIPIENSQEAVVIRVVDFAGNIQTEQGWITSAPPKLANEFIEPNEPRKISAVASATQEKPVENPPVVPKELPESERTPAAIENVSVTEAPINRPGLFTPSLGWTSLSYSEVGGIDFSESAVHFGIDYEHPIFSEVTTRWSLGVSADAALLPLNETGSSLGMKMFDVETFAAYSFTDTHSAWDFSVRGGAYYTTTSVSGNAFGFTNMFGPEIYPVLSRSFTKGGVASLHFKYAPVIDSSSGFTFTSHALDAGLSYATAPSSGAWVFSGDYKKLNANVDATSVQLSGFSLSLGRTF
jgi:hypothetical protein